MAETNYNPGLLGFQHLKQSSVLETKHLKQSSLLGNQIEAKSKGGSSMGQLRSRPLLIGLLEEAGVLFRELM